MSGTGVQVAAPAIKPPRGGIFSVANVTNVGVGDKAVYGVQYQPQAVDLGYALAPEPCTFIGFDVEAFPADDTYISTTAAGLVLTVTVHTTVVGTYTFHSTGTGAPADSTLVISDVNANNTKAITYTSGTYGLTVTGPSSFSESVTGLVMPDAAAKTTASDNSKKVIVTIRSRTAETYTIDPGDGSGNQTLAVTTPSVATRANGNTNTKTITYAATHNSLVMHVTAPSGFDFSAPIEVPMIGHYSTVEKHYSFIDWVQADTPFTIYRGVQCSSYGWQEYAGEAEGQLAAVKQYAVEEQVWDILGERAVDVTPTPGTAVSPVIGLAILEDWIAQTYPGIGVMHMPRGAATLANQAIDWMGDELTTQVGSEVVAGAGYNSPLGPGGVSADAGTVWMFASGQIGIWEGPVTTSLASSVDVKQNLYAALAEQAFVTVIEGQVAAVLVSYAAATGGGSGSSGDGVVTNPGDSQYLIQE